MSGKKSSGSVMQAGSGSNLAGVVALLFMVGLLIAVSVLLIAVYRSGGQAPAGEVGEHRESTTLTAASRDPARAAGIADRRELPPAPTVASRPSTLTVTVLFDDGMPAAGMEVLLRKLGEHPRLHARSRIADPEGVVHYDDLSAGEYKVWTSQSIEMLSDYREIDAHSIVDWTVYLPVKTRVSGRVVTALGEPVAGAEIITAPLGMVGQDASTATSTAADGTFELRSSLNPLFVGARAHLHAASRMHYLRSRSGGEFDLTIVLKNPGSTVEGVVRGVSGQPLANAVVRVGAGRLDSIAGRGNSAPPLPAQVRTDAQGRFRAVGIPVGSTKVFVRAVGHAPQARQCEVVNAATVTQEFDLVAGANVRGTVRDQAGLPLDHAEVWHGAPGELTYTRDVTDDDGRFVLAGLAEGPLSIECSHYLDGFAQGTTIGVSGEWAELDLVVDPGRVVEGWVVADGTPLARVAVHAALVGGDESWGATQYTDVEGGFRFVNIGAGEVHLQAKHAAIEEARRVVLATDRGSIVWNVVSREMPKGVLHGSLADPTGEPVAQAALTLQRKSLGPPGSGSFTDLSATSGDFEFEALPAGEYYLRVMADGFAPLIRDGLQVDGSEELDLGRLVMTDGYAMEVQVEDAGDSGSALDRAVVILSDQDMRFLDSAMVSDVGGIRFELGLGRYWLELRGRGLGNVFVPVDLAADQLVRLPAYAGVATTLRFIGADRWGSIDEGLLVIAGEHGVSVRRTVRCGPGCPDRFETTLRPGTYDVTFTLAKTQPARLIVEAGGAGASLDVELR